MYYVLGKERWLSPLHNSKISKHDKRIKDFSKSLLERYKYLERIDQGEAIIDEYQWDVINHIARQIFRSIEKPELPEDVRNFAKYLPIQIGRLSTILTMIRKIDADFEEDAFKNLELFRYVEVRDDDVETAATFVNILAEHTIEVAKMKCSSDFDY